MPSTRDVPAYLYGVALSIINAVLTVWLVALLWGSWWATVAGVLGATSTGALAGGTTAVYRGRR